MLEGNGFGEPTTITKAFSEDELISAIESGWQVDPF
jgi:hypothetical protein